MVQGAHVGVLDFRSLRSGEPELGGRGGGCLVTLTDAAKGEGRSPPVNPKTVIDRSQEQ